MVKSIHISYDIMYLFHRQRVKPMKQRGGIMVHERQAVGFSESGISSGLPQVPKVELVSEVQGRDRLNIVLPNFFKNYAFGGIFSAMKLARELTRHYDDVRFLSLAPLGNDEEMFAFQSHVLGGGKKDIRVESLLGRDSLLCHRREVFFCTYWGTVLQWRAYARALESSGARPNPFYYFIQDFEPGFYPFDARYAACQSTYSHGEHTHALFNALELARYFKRHGFSFRGEQTLLPSVNPVISRWIAGHNGMLPPKPEDRITIVIYGRPQNPRNCFNALIEGLHLCFSELPEDKHQGVEIISAGRDHPDIELVPGVTVRSVGKLELRDYVALLERAHIGVSLMASPHPSYPPLEMAIMGLAVITNSFDCKDISKHHPGIHSLDEPDPATLALEVARALRDVRAGIRGCGGEAAMIPSNMSPLPWGENLQRMSIPKLEPAN